MIWWYCEHHCHVEAYTTIVVIFLTLLMADFNGRWPSPPCTSTHTHTSKCRESPPPHPLSSALKLFQFCLAPVYRGRSLDLSLLQASGSSVLAPGCGSSQGAAAAARCCHALLPPRSPSGRKASCEGRLSGTSAPSSSSTLQMLMQSL